MRLRNGIGFGASVAERVQEGKRGGVYLQGVQGWKPVDRRVQDSPSEGLTPNDFGKDNAKLLERGYAFECVPLSSAGRLRTGGRSAQGAGANSTVGNLVRRGRTT
ncbi:hypothetical protein GCM10009742_03850 [Kribbella karoonensis]|uniref:Uncharacterized protein n=1 Tax=Kribbella karoonensis TaxID=324851 RepID=A0ABN2CXV3_9ACTN